MGYIGKIVRQKQLLPLFQRASKAREGFAPPKSKHPFKERSPNPKYHSNLKLLKLLPLVGTREEYLNKVVRCIAEWCGCQGAGIRLNDAQGGLPFAAKLGINQRFVEQEEALWLARQKCECVHILRAQSQSGTQPFVIRQGSLFTGHPNVCQAVRCRNKKAVCLAAGYKSIVHCAIQHHGEFLGSIHLLDRRIGHFSPDTVAFVEAIAGLLGEGLQRFAVEHAMLEKQLLEVSEKERQRVGQDLHDSVGGKLAGLALMAKVLAQKLSSTSHPYASLAEEVVHGINDSIRQTREIARGLCPVDLDEGGLIAILDGFAAEIRNSFGIKCSLHYSPGIQVQDPVLVAHLYRIVQEAVNNSIRHGRSRSVQIRLTQPHHHLCLKVADDGIGLRANLDTTHGLGFRTMTYRARLLGGRLAVQPNSRKGTLVTCLVPFSEPAKDNSYPDE